jgi:hypothetical protein
MIGEQNLTAAFAECIQLVLPYQRFQMIDCRVFGKEVIPFGALPEFPKLAVIEKNIWGVWSVRSIDQIVKSSI